MSELNEDILNYEIGDVDADDTDLTGADEDELLLSDEESVSVRLAPNQEDDLLSTVQADSEQSQIEQSSDLDSETINKNDSATQSSDDKSELAGLKASRNAVESTHVQPSGRKSLSISPESDLVTSTYKEDDEIPPQPTQSQCATEQKECDPSFGSDEKSESTAYEESEAEYSHSEQTDNKSESTVVSQGVSEDTSVNSERTLEDYDPDDSENVRERRNPKTCVEREMPPQFEDNSRPKNFSQNFQRNRHARPQMPRPNHPFGIPGGPDFNPSFMPQFRGIRRPMLPGPQSDFLRGHSMNMMRGPPNHMQRMPPGMPPHPSRMPPSLLGPPHQRLPRPPFQNPPAMFGNNPGMPPQGMIRPRVPPNAHQMMPQRPPFVPFNQPNHPANMRHPMNPSLPPHPQPINAAIPSQNLPPSLLGGQRKVLINPNFKGGVQAATNQLMLDTMKNSQIHHVLENNREAELLRQQEAFINQNRLHIEKRRRSRDHSPERDREYRDRDRERERSYSPPRRRERDIRKPYSAFRENRNRRADSRDRENPDMKRKRSDGDGNMDKNEPKTDEDEETRAYRLEIEKQKAQREKILRDKEMRRRKAAEDLKKDEEKKVGDEPLQKFTPLIVTEKKIISLKKKAADGPSDQPQKPKTVAITRKSQTPSLTENVISESASQTKTVLRTSSGSKKLRLDDDDIDEDELLADSPPLTPASDGALKSRTNASKVGDIPTTMFTNRRVVVRNADNVTNNENNLTNKATSGTGKGIFDRLDKKVISVNEAAKRKIQRIVINNSE